jgi:hypothetical protein
MFRLHETSRRRVCRIAFVAFCLAPTAATAAWIAHWHRPWRVADQETRLSAYLGLGVRLADWREPRPGGGRTSTLTLVDPSTAAIVELADLSLARAGASTSLVAQAATLDVQSFDELAVLAREALNRHGDLDLTIQAGTVTASDGGDRTLALEGVAVKIDRDADGGRQGQLVARVADGSNTPPVVRVALKAVGAGLKRRIEATIDARNAKLPGWLVDDLVPVIGDVGDAATFTGLVRMEFASDHVQGVASGQLETVSLSAMLGSGKVHAARGHATVTLQELRWRDGRIEGMAGVVQSENAEVSQSLVAAAVANLFCGNASAELFKPEHQAKPVSIDRLACRFQLDQTGLSLAGAIPPDAALPHGCIAASGGRPLLTTPPYPRLPAGAWVQFVSGPAQSWVPATRSAVDMAQRMPLPEAGEILAR